ncbi:MAG: hypothetical protein U0457_03370 [Candidatus Sericytochromatia bacterium]
MSGVTNGLAPLGQIQSVTGANNTQRTNQPVTSTPVKSSISGYPYSDDVFTGQFQSFKDMYKGLDTGISKFSPFYGKMQMQQPEAQGNLGQANPNVNFVDGGNNQMPQNNQGGFVPPPANPNGYNNQQVPQNNQGGFVPPPSNPNGNSTLPPLGNNQQGNNIPTGKTFPQKQIPSGPVVNTLQQQLQQEAQGLQTPQKAIESVASHAMLSRQERTIANDVAWGAKFYAQKANDLANQILKNKGSMNPQQIQAKATEVESLKLKSISLLNEAKKHAINTYTEATKATLIYNNYFAGNGQFATLLNDSDRQFVESEIDKTWSNWTGGFDRDFNGQKVHADEAPTVIDKAAGDVNNLMNSTNNILNQLK